jgi:hypothetical protein
MGNVEMNDLQRVVTVADLQNFKLELLRELRKILAVQQVLPHKPFLKSHEVRRLLKISQGTLQHLRDTGKLKFSKVGGIIFYDVKEVEEMVRRGSDSGETTI